MGRSKLPEDKKRILVFGRVDPATVTFLDSLGEDNHGRALDRTVALARGMEAALRQMGPQVTQVSPWRGDAKEPPAS